MGIKICLSLDHTKVKIIRCSAPDAALRKRSG
jgi:hypothetical protein